MVTWSEIREAQGVAAGGCSIATSADGDLLRDVAFGPACDWAEDASRKSRGVVFFVSDFRGAIKVLFRDGLELTPENVPGF